MVRDDQPDAREGEAGRSWVAERFVVPVKPGNAGGGKGPQFKTDARRGEGPGDWATYQLRIAFRNCRRRCTRKRRQTRLSLLRPLRQDQPRGHSGARLCPVPLQQGRAGRGPSGLRGCQGVRGRAMAGRTGACAQAGDLPTGASGACCAVRVKPETSALARSANSDTASARADRGKLIRGRQPERRQPVARLAAHP